MNICSPFMVKGLGFPSWFPSTAVNLPAEYVESGIRIGDVGIINSTGDFDFLFNICLPADHSVNANCVPNGFRPLPMPDPVDIKSQIEHCHDTFLMSRAMQVCSHEGAILILPEGSHREDLHAIGAFQAYASRNGECWYHYANRLDAGEQ
ncbi:hypothetical protein BDQ17DRAFT_1509718 [Cyathus striatus]|nr:hypothetical protein BDQ17DRAFT_1509718 [Cyathus striatus]